MQTLAALGHIQACCTRTGLPTASMTGPTCWLGAMPLTCS